MRKVAVVIFLEVLLVLRVVAGSSARLDGSVRPIVYDLKLTLSSALETISGQVEIEIQCITPTTTITLHAHPNYIKIHHSIIHDRFLNTSTSLELPEVNTKDHQTTFKLITPLTAGHVYYLSIWFTTRYSMAATKGFAQTHDVDRGTWMNSLLELQHARELLPCFDEPSYRSVFRLQLWLHSDFADDTYVALSNTDGIKEIWSETLSIWTFEPTLPIPSYLFTIAVGRFESFCRIPKNLREKKICIWRFADKEKWESMAEKVVEQMALFHQSMLDYLLVDPVARLHLLVIPMKLNGMENFGLLNIRESLWPQENDTISFNKFRKTLFHEMAHQWFGNLVTMHWWNDIWLSESITSFLSAIAPLKPDTHMDLSVEPLVNDKWAVSIPLMSYQKGAVIVQMLDDVIGPDRFQRLLRHYVRIYQFGVASTHDFLKLLRRVTKDMKTDIVEFFSVWLHQGSHPIVFIDYDKSLNRFILTQTPKMGSPEARWPIPIWTECVSGKRKPQLHWIPRNKQLVLDLDQLTGTNSSSGVAFNRKKTVYYQLSYRY